MRNKYEKARREISKIQKKYGVSDCNTPETEGTVTYETFCMFCYGYLPSIPTKDMYKDIINKYGEANIRLDLYKLFIRSDRRMISLIILGVLVISITICMIVISSIFGGFTIWK